MYVWVYMHISLGSDLDERASRAPLSSASPDCSLGSALSIKNRPAHMAFRQYLLVALLFAAGVIADDAAPTEAPATAPECKWSWYKLGCTPTADCKLKFRPRLGTFGPCVPRTAAAPKEECSEGAAAARGETEAAAEPAASPAEEAPAEAAPAEAEAAPAEAAAAPPAEAEAATAEVAQ